MFKKVQRNIKRKQEGKVGLKYRVDIVVSSIDNIPGPIKECRVVCARSAKVQYTKLGRVEDGKATFGETLSLIVSFYKDKTNRFEDKEYSFKIQVPAKSDRSKMCTIGKINVNLAQFVMLEERESAVTVPIPYKVGEKGKKGNLQCRVITSLLAEMDIDGMTEVSGMTGLSSNIDTYQLEQDLEGFDDHKDDHHRGQEDASGSGSAEPHAAHRGDSVTSDRPAPHAPGHPAKASHHAAAKHGSSRLSASGASENPFMKQGSRVSPGADHMDGDGVSRAELDRLRRENAELKSEVGNLMGKSTEADALRRALKRKEEKLTKENAKLADRVAELEGARDEEAEARARELGEKARKADEQASASAAAAVAQHAAMQDRLREAHAAHDKADHDAAALQARVAAAEAQATSLEAQVARLGADLAARGDELAAAKRQLTAAVEGEATARAELEEAVRERAAGGAEAGLREELEEARALLADEKSTTAALEAKLQEREAEVTEQFMQQSALSKQLDESQESAQETRQKMASLEKAVAEAERAAQIEQKERESLQRQLHTLQGSEPMKVEQAVEIAIAARQAAHDEQLQQLMADVQELQQQVLGADEEFAILDQKLTEATRAKTHAVKEKEALEIALQEASDHNMTLERELKDGGRGASGTDVAKIIRELATIKLQYAELSEHEVQLRRDLFRMREYNTVVAAKATKLELLLHTSNQSSSKKSSKSSWFYSSKSTSSKGSAAHHQQIP